ncbi:hypothetical protein ACP70R_015107 [Stipagrostis hirtigluma subsp. patula]
MSCLGRAAVPARRVWRGLRARLGLRRTAGKSPASYVPMSPESDNHDMEEVGVLAGLGRLRTEVRTCEYHDVHVMWEMLSNTGAGNGGGDGAMADVAAGNPTPTRRVRTRRGRKAAAWSHRLVSYCCAL